MHFPVSFCRWQHSLRRRVSWIQCLFYLFFLFLLQVVKVMVLKCEPQQERLLLSFRLSSKPTPEDKKECPPKKKQEVKYQIGEVLNSMAALFFAFSYLFCKWFGITLNNFVSRKAVGGQELALWLASSIKSGILLSEVRIRETQDSPGGSCSKVKSFFFWMMLMFSLQKQLLLVSEKVLQRTVLKCFPVVFGMNSFLHPADIANAGTGLFSSCLNYCLCPSNKKSQPRECLALNFSGRWELLFIVLSTLACSLGWALLMVDFLIYSWEAMSEPLQHSVWYPVHQKGWPERYLKFCITVFILFSDGWCESPEEER